MQCPTCPVSLVALRVGELELDECPRCLGMWFDKGEVQRFLAARLAARTVQQRFVPPGKAQQVPAYASCPRCLTARLQSRTGAGLTTENCARCEGSWISAAVISAVLSVSAEELAAEEESAEGSAPASPALGATGPAPNASAPIASGSVAEAEAPAPRRAPQPAAAALVGGCTACGANMEPVSYEGQSFHRCSKCEALFFSRGGLPRFVSRHARSWTPPTSPAPDPADQARCPGCSYGMQPMTLQGHSVRAWACMECWSMFASANGVRRLCRPEEFLEENLSQPALTLWRMLDAFTEWVVNPPKSGRYRVR